MAHRQPNRDRMKTLASALDDLFGVDAGTAWGAAPVEIVEAPGRVNLMGDHTDYNDGFVLPAAIDLGTWIAFRRRRDGLVRVASRHSREIGSFRIDALARAGEPAQTGEPAHTGGRGAGSRAEAPGGAGVQDGGGDSSAVTSGATTRPTDLWTDCVAGAAWSLREAGLPLHGFDGIVDTTIPTGSGLAARAALEVAAALALLDDPDSVAAPSLAALAQRAERDYLGADTGIVDQFASAAGREGKALLLDCRSLDARYVALPFGVRVVVCDTGARAEPRSPIPDVRRAECARAVALLSERMPGLCSLRDLDPASLRRHRGLLPENVARRAEHVVAENARVVATASAMESGDLDELGRLFAESHASLRDLYEVSSPALNTMVEVALSIPGVVAARMTGSGLGGSTVNLVLADAVPALQAAVSREYDRRSGLRGRVYPVSIVDGAGPVQLD